MDQREFDGIYGEADTWLSEGELVTIDDELSQSNTNRPSTADPLPDLDTRRARRVRLHINDVQDL